MGISGRESIITGYFFNHLDLLPVNSWINVGLLVAKLWEPYRCHAWKNNSVFWLSNLEQKTRRERRESGSRFSAWVCSDALTLPVTWLAAIVTCPYILVGLNLWAPLMETQVTICLSTQDTSYWNPLLPSSSSECQWQAHYPGQSTLTKAMQSSTWHIISKGSHWACLKWDIPEPPPLRTAVQTCPIHIESVGTWPFDPCQSSDPLDRK